MDLGGIGDDMRNLVMNFMKEYRGIGLIGERLSLVSDHGGQGHIPMRLYGRRPDAGMMGGNVRVRPDEIDEHLSSDAASASQSSKTPSRSPRTVAAHDLEELGHSIADAGGGPRNR